MSACCQVGDDRVKLPHSLLISAQHAHTSRCRLVAVCADAAAGAAFSSLRNRILRTCTKLSITGCNHVTNTFAQELLSPVPQVRFISNA